MTQPSDRVLMCFGSFEFVIGRSAYDKMSRTTTYRWTSLPRLNGRPQLQYDGPGEETMRISGEAFQLEDRVDPREIYDQLKELGDKPQVLVDANGINHGRWCLQSISFDADEIDPFSMPKKMSFSMELKLYDKNKV